MVSLISIYYCRYIYFKYTDLCSGTTSINHHREQLTGNFTKITFRNSICLTVNRRLVGPSHQSDD